MWFQKKAASTVLTSLTLASMWLHSQHSENRVWEMWWINSSGLETCSWFLCLWLPLVEDILLHGRRAGHSSDWKCTSQFITEAVIIKIKHISDYVSSHLVIIRIISLYPFTVNVSFKCTCTNTHTFLCFPCFLGTFIDIIHNPAPYLYPNYPYLPLPLT